MNGDAECTIFANIYSNDPHTITIDAMLERIRTGASKKRIEEIRKVLDKKKADLLKRELPSVCPAGTFKERKDEALVKHSGFLILDFDEVTDVVVKSIEILKHDFVYAIWLSPRGNGLKVLVIIADGKKHREHFDALKEIFPDVDRSGVNVSRVCYESYDPNLVINKNAKPFTKLKSVVRVDTKQVIADHQEIFKNILIWLANRHDSFVSGERNMFVFKLAGALCRFGVDRYTAEYLILHEFPTSNDFTDNESKKAIKSAYRKNELQAGTAIFERDRLIDRENRSEVMIDVPEEFTKRLRDVVYGQDIKQDALDIYDSGYQFVSPIGIFELDKLFKMRKGEITLLTGIGNYGKSMFKKWYQVMRAVVFDERFASFPPEDYPIHNYYHELTEILLGQDCTPTNPKRPSRVEYSAAFDFISSHFFYINPTDLSPTPEYMKQRFLELIIKEKIDGCDIDPFNQMTNDYGKYGGRSDKYLETILADFLRFGQQNNVYFWIIAHPVKMHKAKNDNYPCPDVFDVADGAMWSNKMSNILVYHRPFMQTEPENAMVEFHTKKIKDQKTVGKRGMILFDLNKRNRRFEFDGVDHLELALERRKLYFGLEERLKQPF